jgi:hypothetical protein
MQSMMSASVMSLQISSSPYWWEDIALAGPLPFGAGGLADVVLVDPIQGVPCAVVATVLAEVGDRVDDLAHQLFVHPACLGGRPEDVLARHSSGSSGVLLSRSGPRLAWSALKAS